MLSDRCLSCPSCLSVTNVGVLWQTVGWIKMPLGMEAGLGHGHSVLDGDLAPPHKRGTAPNFGSISVGSKTAGCIIQDATRYGSRRRPRPHCWDPAPPKMGEQQPLLNCWPMSIVAKRSPISATAKLFLCIIKPNKCSAVAEMGDRKEGEAAVSFSGVGAGSPSNRMWPALRSTLVPSDILIHPAVWPQKCGGVLCSCFRGAGSPSNTDTQCGLTQGLPPYQLLS